MKPNMGKALFDWIGSFIELIPKFSQPRLLLIYVYGNAVRLNIHVLYQYQTNFIYKLSNMLS